MLLSIIDEIKKALDNDMYVAALSLALTIPDICGKAEYPKYNNKDRYIGWYDKYIGYYENPDNGEIIYTKQDEDNQESENNKKTKCPYLSGEVVYSLRNSMLHQGTPNIDKEKIDDDRNKIDRFILVKQSKNKYNIYSDSSSYSKNGLVYGYDGEYKTYNLNIRRLCNNICSDAELYYEDNKEKFNFFNYTLVDKEHELDFELIEKNYK